MNPYDTYLRRIHNIPNGGNLYPYAIVKGYVEFDGMPTPAQPIKVGVKEKGSFLYKRENILWEFPLMFAK